MGVNGGEEVPGFAQSNQQISAFMDAVSYSPHSAADHIRGETGGAAEVR